jgi:hypothetical protein
MCALVLAAVTLAACGGTKDNRSATTKKVTTTSAIGGGSTTTDVGTPSGSQASNNLHNSGQPGTTAKASGAPSAGSNGSSPPASTSGLQPTAPGTYSYSVTGTRTATDTVKVDPATGADQHSTATSARGSTEQTLRYLPNGIYLVDLKVAGMDFRSSDGQPVLEYPEPAPVGKTWSWSVTSGGITVTTNFQVVRTETQMVGSESVPTTVLHATITTSGSIQSSSDDTIWVSEHYRMIIRTDDKTTSNNPFVGNSTTSSKLTSTHPS